MIWTASRPLAWGAALPSTRDVVEMARQEGRAVDVDDACLEEIDDWFHWVAYQGGAEGSRGGAPSIPGTTSAMSGTRFRAA